MISVLTPTIPERSDLLRECMLSVEAQTLSGLEYEHLIGVDEEHVGCSVTINKLAAEAKGEWLLPLADDDLLLPGALTRLIEAEGDIIYSAPLMAHPASWHFFQEPPLIPSTALIRRDLWLECGGYDESVVREEDRGLWIKALEQGARFTRIGEPVWVYRLHGGNKSYRNGVAS